MSSGITDEQGRQLVDLARKTLEEKLESRGAAFEPVDSQLQEHGATFVTLKIDEKLRGCIGNLEPVSSIWEGVRRNAINAAFHDHRFSPLTREELGLVRVDISVLSQPEKLDYSDGDDLIQKLRPGIDGVILRDGAKGATFLPQVWDQIPTVELFLSHLCLKAGLVKDLWKVEKLEIQTYQVQHFTEKAE